MIASINSPASGGFGRELRDERARRDLGEDGELFDTLEVVGDPVDEGTAVVAEPFGAHVAERRSNPIRTCHVQGFRSSSRSATRPAIGPEVRPGASVAPPSWPRGGPRRTAGRRENTRRIDEIRTVGKSGGWWISWF